MAKTAKNIAIDGYSSCGKSTVARALAQRINFSYIDSGAMYRCVTLYLLRLAVENFDDANITMLLKNIQIRFQGDAILLNDEDVSEEIRSMMVSQKVSQISALPIVRKEMVRLQQQMGKEHNVVMDGRDIGTTVFPNADLKIFMTADPHIRALRRYTELQKKGVETSLEEVSENLRMRDHEDTHRKESPLVQAADAILLDNSTLNQEEQLDLVYQLLLARNII
jgi:cytidylate kinase